MSHSSYTASERRGIIVIALISLLLIASGVGMGLYSMKQNEVEEIPLVEEHPEMIDTVNRGSSDKKIKKKKKSSSSSSKEKSKKEYRRRSPNDEII